MEVESTINIYDVDGEEQSIPSPKLLVRSVWNASKKVEIEFEGKRVTVIGEQLERAIRNALNVSRF